MRSRATLLILLLVFGGATAATAGRDPRAEKLRLNRHDMALAQRLTLSARDLTSGWQRLRAPAPFSTGVTGCPRFHPNLSAFTITGQARSLFISGDRRGSIASSVAVFRSRSEAILDFLATAKPRFVHCVASSVLSSSRRSLRQHETARLLSARMLPEPTVGHRSAGYRVIVELRGRAGSLKTYTDVVAFQRGRSIAVLAFISLSAPLDGELTFARAVDARMLKP
jgi:hypothetical protein